MNTRPNLLASLAALICACTSAQAKEEPLWEAGVGVAALTFPAYRGSDRIHNFLMPVPYFTYHGDFLRADRHGIRGNLFDSKTVEFDLSFSASPPTRSKDAPIRDGMPNLKPTVEFGPELDFNLWRSASGSRTLKLRLPTRAAFSVESKPENIGWVFSPNLNLDITDLPGASGWNFGFLAGPIYATRKQHEYFYGVAPQYQTATRSAYEAGGGYSGARILASASKRFAQTWVGAFVRYDNLHGAVFEDSPLVTSKRFVAAGVSVSWILGASQTRVNVED